MRCGVIRRRRTMISGKAAVGQAKNSGGGSGQIAGLFSLACPLLTVLRRFHAAEAEMICAGVDFAFAACPDDVTRVVLIVAKKRAATMHPFFLVRFGWIERRSGSLRIARDAARVSERLGIIGPIPIAAPFPDLAGYVVERV